MNDFFNSTSDLVNNYFVNINDENTDSLKINRSWREILFSIKSNRPDSERVDIGSQLADHSKIADFKNGTVFVETDHPARIQLFQMYRNYILKCLTDKYPELGIKSLSFYIKKERKASHSSLRDVTSDEIEKAIEKRTESLEKNIDNKEREVNEEVKKLFSGFFS